MKLVFAPIQGNTNFYYRNAYNKYFGQYDSYYAPFIATSSMRKDNSPLFKDLLPEKNTPDVHVIPQLLGNNSDDFIYFANRIEALGYDEINWNIGCPYPTVTKKKKGSGLLVYPEIVDAFLDNICAKTQLPVSIKMRLGVNDVCEGEKIVDIINQYPIKNVTLHGRTTIQKYEGTVNLDAFDQLYRLIKSPVIYNGDIFTAEDYDHVQDRYPNIDTFMIGRGALRNPFLAQEIQGIYKNNEEKLNTLRLFHDEIFHYFLTHLSGDRHVLDKMKEFWVYIGYYLIDNKKTMKKINKCQKITQYLSIVEELFNHDFNQIFSL